MWGGGMLSCLLHAIFLFVGFSHFVFGWGLSDDVTPNCFSIKYKVQVPNLPDRAITVSERWGPLIRSAASHIHNPRV